MNFKITGLLRSVLPLAVFLAACGGGGGSSSSSSTNPYSVGGTLTGLSSGNSITLTNNGSDNLQLTANGSFSFANKLADTAAYSLTLTATTPTAQPCSSTYGAGIINAANVTSLNVFYGLAGGSGTFTAPGPMATARAYHTATLLPNGKVLVAGGGYTSTELYF